MKDFCSSDVFIRNSLHFFRRYSNKYLLIPQNKTNAKFRLYEVHHAAFRLWEFLSVPRRYDELAILLADLSRKERISPNILRTTFAEMLQNAIVLRNDAKTCHVRTGLQSSPEMHMDLSEYVLTLAKRRRLPLMCTFELTHRCNLNCTHCYAKSTPVAKKAELSTAFILSLLDEIAEAGCISILFTGGEIFLRRDFHAIYEHAKQIGFIITLYTNGTLVDGEVLALLTSLPPFKIEISMYGATEATYESVTRVKGSFDAFQRTTNLLGEQGIPFVLKTVLLRANKNELKNMKLFAKTLGVQFYYDSLVHAKLDKSPPDSRLSIEESLKLDHYGCEKRKAYVDFAKHRQLHSRGDRKLYSCRGGISGFNISPQGKLTVCILSSNPAYDLHNLSFLDAWKRLAAISRYKYPRSSRCSYCRKYLVCRVCPAISKLETGDEHLPVDYLCRIAEKVIDKYGLV